MSLSGDGHGAECAFCGEPCDSLAGDPGKWPLVFTHPDGTGVAKAHHTKCVQDRLFCFPWPKPSDP